MAQSRQKCKEEKPIVDDENIEIVILGYCHAVLQKRLAYHLSHFRIINPQS